MTVKRVDSTTEFLPAVPAVGDLSEVANHELVGQLRFGPPNDVELPVIAQIRSQSEPWRGRGETPEQSLEALSTLRQAVQVARLHAQAVGYVTVERDGPVPGAAYLRNIVVRGDLRRRGIGSALMNHAIETGRDMFRKTIALRVDPANAMAVGFYRTQGFTTVATVVSKKSGKLRLLMSREL